MAMKHSTFRLEAADIRLLEREASRLTRETGVKVTRTDVLRKLIRENLRRAKKTA